MGAIEPSVVLQRHRVTVEEYHRMAETGILAPDARVELIEGEVIDMAPMNSRHAWVVTMLISRLQAAHGRGIVTCQTPLRLGTHGEPEPDLMLLRPRDGGYAAALPAPADVLLLIEVADTSLDYDRLVKMPLYAREGVCEAWIVDLVNRQVRFYRQPQGGAYADVTSTETPGLTPVIALPGIEIDLAGLFG